MLKNINFIEEWKSLKNCHEYIEAKLLQNLGNLILDILGITSIN